MKGWNTETFCCTTTSFRADSNLVSYICSRRPRLYLHLEKFNIWTASMTQQLLLPSVLMRGFFELDLLIAVAVARTANWQKKQQQPHRLSSLLLPGGVGVTALIKNAVLRSRNSSPRSHLVQQHAESQRRMLVKRLRVARWNFCRVSRLPRLKGASQIALCLFTIFSQVGGRHT